MANTAIQKLIQADETIFGFDSAVSSPPIDQSVNTLSWVSSAVGTFWNANRAIASMGMTKYAAMRMRNPHLKTKPFRDAVMSGSI